MKGNKIIVGFWLLLAIGIMLGSCTKSNDGPKTIALIGTEYYIGKDYSIEDILSAIPDSYQQEFDSVFGVVPDGPIPPSIAVSDSIMETDSVDSYVVNPNMLVSTNLNIPTPRQDPPVFMRFSEQHNGIMVMELYEGSLKKTDTVYVRGNNEDFTIYFVEDKSIEHVKRGVIMCGKVKENGLSNFRMAFIVVDAIGDLALDPGTYFIYKDGDSLVERCAWPW